MKNIQSKLSLFLCIVLSISLLSSCAVFGGSKEEDKGNTSQTEKVDSTEMIDSTEVESSEIENIENDSTETTQSESSVILNTEVTNTKPQNPSGSESDSKKEEQNTTTKPEDVDPGEKLAKEIVNQIITPGMSEFEKAITIHDWLTFNIDYDLTYSHYDLEETLRDRTGVCQGYALAFNSMAKHAGLNCVYITGTADNGSGGGYQGHAWNRVKINGVWYNVDVTWDDPVYEGKKPSDHSMNGYGYFLVSDATLNKDHKVGMIAAETGDATKDYDRGAIYKYAASSGKHGDIEYASSVAEAGKTIDQKFTEDVSEFWLWYYSPSLTNDNMLQELSNQMISASMVPFMYCSGYTGVLNGMTRIHFTYQYRYSEWNSYPVVHNATEFEALFQDMQGKGIKEFTLRYETTDKNFDFGTANNFGYSMREYKDTNCLITVTTS